MVHQRRLCSSMTRGATRIRRDASVPESEAGARLDQAAARLFPEFSRSRLQEWIRSGELRVDGQIWKISAKLQGDERLSLEAELEARYGVEAQAIDLQVIFEDEHLLVVDKPAGMVVHPAAGHAGGTLQNALLHHQPSLAEIPRAGIVHRLDKLTSGLLLIAKSLTAHTHLVEALRRREIERRYLALALGELITGTTIDAPLGRHSVDRKKQIVRDDGRHAVTHIRVQERFAGCTLVEARLETGRTHQIRVHMAHIGYPLVGDPVYGGKGRVPPGVSKLQRLAIQCFDRQALHAQALELAHPVTGKTLRFRSELPEDFDQLVQVLRTHAG